MRTSSSSARERTRRQGVWTSVRCTPGSVGIGVALTSTRTLRPSGTETSISSARIVSPLLTTCSIRNSQRLASLPWGAAERHHLLELLGGTARHALVLPDPPRLAVAGRHSQSSTVDGERCTARADLLPFQNGNCKRRNKNSSITIKRLHG